MGAVLGIMLFLASRKWRNISRKVGKICPRRIWCSGIFEDEARSRQFRTSNS